MVIIFQNFTDYYFGSDIEIINPSMNVSGILNGKIDKDKEKEKDKGKDKGKGSTITLVSPIESEILSKYEKKVFKSNLNRRKVSEIDEKS